MYLTYQLPQGRNRSISGALQDVIINYCSRSKWKGVAENFMHLLRKRSIKIWHKALMIAKILDMMQHGTISLTFWRVHPTWGFRIWILNNCYKKLNNFKERSRTAWLPTLANTHVQVQTMHTPHTKFRHLDECQKSAQWNREHLQNINPKHIILIPSFMALKFNGAKGISFFFFLS